MASRIRTHIIYNPLMGFAGTLTTFESPAWQPRVDIYELDDAIIVQVEAPGLQIEELKIGFEAGQLIVEGVRTHPPLPSPARAALVEMNYGPFRRALPLPDDIDGDGIRATYDAGVIQVHVPRRPPMRPKRIDIQIS